MLDTTVTFTARWHREHAESLDDLREWARGEAETLPLLECRYRLCRPDADSVHVAVAMRGRYDVHTYDAAGEPT